MYEKRQKAYQTDKVKSAGNISNELKLGKTTVLPNGAFQITLEASLHTKSLREVFA